MVGTQARQGPNGRVGPPALGPSQLSAGLHRLILWWRCRHKLWLDGAATSSPRAWGTRASKASSIMPSHPVTGASDCSSAMARAGAKSSVPKSSPSFPVAFSEVSQARSCCWVNM
jgi:hypothetical protein